MSSDFQQLPREEQETRLTALLLGELSAEQAEEVRRAMVADAELGRLCLQLEATIDLLREAAADPGQPTSAPSVQHPRMGSEKRERLLCRLRGEAEEGGSALDSSDPERRAPSGSSEAPRVVPVEFVDSPRTGGGGSIWLVLAASLVAVLGMLGIWLAGAPGSRMAAGDVLSLARHSEREETRRWFRGRAAKDTDRSETTADASSIHERKLSLDGEERFLQQQLIASPAPPLLGGGLAPSAGKPMGGRGLARVSGEDRNAPANASDSKGFQNRAPASAPVPPPSPAPVRQLAEVEGLTEDSGKKAERSVEARPELMRRFGLVASTPTTTPTAPVVSSAGQTEGRVNADSLQRGRVAQESKDQLEAVELGFAVTAPSPAPEAKARGASASPSRAQFGSGRRGVQIAETAGLAGVPVAGAASPADAGVVKGLAVVADAPERLAAVVDFAMPAAPPVNAPRAAGAVAVNGPVSRAELVASGPAEPVARFRAQIASSSVAASPVVPSANEGPAGPGRPSGGTTAFYANAVPTDDFGRTAATRGEALETMAGTDAVKFNVQSPAFFKQKAVEVPATSTLRADVFFDQASGDVSNGRSGSAELAGSAGGLGGGVSFGGGGGGGAGGAVARGKVASLGDEPQLGRLFGSWAESSPNRGFGGGEVARKAADKSPAPSSVQHWSFDVDSVAAVSGDKLPSLNQVPTVAAASKPVMLAAGEFVVPAGTSSPEGKLPAKPARVSGIVKEDETRPIGELAKLAIQAEEKPVLLEALQDLEKKEVAAEKNALVATPVRAAVIPPTQQPEVATVENAFSTFSLNVTDVSFKLAQASLENGQMPAPDAVRVEEFVNAFQYRDPEPSPGAPVSVTWDRARYPYAHDREVLRLAVRTAAKGRENGRPLNLVLALDNSGSMERADRVQIRREALRTLANQLTPADRVSVVSFARQARVWLDALPGDRAEAMVESAGSLAPEGGTNLEDALRVAYETAYKNFAPQGVNRVVLLTDGAANLGDVQPENLQRMVEENRKRGVATDAFGIGWDGLNDDLLEQLTRRGDGRYGFVNTPEDAATEFAGQLAGALQVAAADVKVQIEFNPRRVKAWRQVGYAKHQLKKEDFRDNTVDAAELGAAESGNALYVIQTTPDGDDPIGTVRVRFRVPETGLYEEREWVVPYVGAAPALETAQAATRLAVNAAAFGEWLARSPYAGEVSPEKLLSSVNGLPSSFQPDPRPAQFENMLRQAQALGNR